MGENEATSFLWMRLCCLCGMFVSVLFISLFAVSAWADNEFSEGIPFAIGDVFDQQWTVTEIKRKPEYLRIQCTNQKQSSTVEVVFNKSGKADQWSTRTHKVQPAPGTNPPDELLISVRNTLSEWESRFPFVLLVSEKVNRKPSASFDRNPTFDVSQPKKFEVREKLASIPKRSMTKVFHAVRWISYSFFVYFALVCLFLLIRSRLTVQNVEQVLAGHFLLLSQSFVEIGKRFNYWFGFRFYSGDVVSQWDSTTIWHHIWVGFLLAFLVFLFLTVLGFEPPLYNDTTEYFIWAKDCLVYNNCYQSGPRSEFKTIEMGALPVYLFMWSIELGLTSSQIHILVNLVYGAGAMLCYFTFIFFLSRRSALTATFYFLIFNLIVMNYPILWNDTISFFFIFLVYLFIFLHIRTGKMVHAILAAFSLFLATEMHIVNSILFPALVLTTILFAKRPFFSTLVAAVIFSELSMFTSLSANITNIKWFALNGYLAYLGSFFTLLVGIGVFFRSRIRNHYRDIGPMAFTGGVTLTVCIVLVSLAVIERHHFYLYYLQPVLPGLSILAARLTMVLIARMALLMGASSSYFFRPVVNVIPLLAFFSYFVLLNVGVFIHEAKTRWTMPDLELVATYLYEKGYSYSELSKRVRTISQPYFIQGLLQFEPEPKANCDKIVGDNRDLLILRVSSEKLPSNLPEEVIVLPSRRGRAVVIIPIEPWLFRQDVEVSRKYFDFYEVFKTKSDTNGFVWEMGNFHMFSLNTEDCKRESSMSYIQRWERESYPKAIKMKSPFWGPESIQATTFRFLLTPNGRDESRLFLVLGEFEKRGWFFDAVNGLPFSGKIPSKAIRIAKDGNNKGKLSVSYYMSKRYSNSFQYPSVLEIPQKYEWVIPALAEVYPRLRPILSRLPPKK